MGWMSDLLRPSPEGRGGSRTMTVAEHNRWVNGEAPGRTAPAPLWRKLLFGEQRAVTNWDVWGGQDGVGTKTNSGTNVSETSAFKFQVVYSAITLIADGVASLPPQAFTEGDDGSMEPAVLPQWIRKPHPEIRRFDVWNQLLISVLAWGNGYAQFIRRPSDGVIIGLSVLDPADVTVEWDDKRPGFRRYRVKNGPWVTSAEIFHIQGPTLPGRAKGMSVVAQAREAIGLGLTLEEFGARYFSQGSQAKIVIELPGNQVPDESKAKAIVSTFERFHRGKGNWHRPALMTGGATLHNISIPPEDAQFLQSREFQATTIAGWFRVPPHRVGLVSKSTSWGSGLAEENMAMLQHTFRPWILRLEGALTAYAPGGEDRGLLIKLGDDVLQRGTFKEAADTWSSLVDKGIATPDEARTKLGLKPMGGEAAKLRDPQAMAKQQQQQAGGGTDPRTKEDDRIRKQDEAAGRSREGKDVLESHYRADSRHLPGKHNQKDHGHGGGGQLATYKDMSPEGQAEMDKLYNDLGTSPAKLDAEIESKLTPEYIAKGKDWYPSASEHGARIARDAGVSHEQALGVLAAVSPQKNWDEGKGNNVEVAEYLSQNYKKWDGIPAEKIGTQMVEGREGQGMVMLHSRMIVSDRDIGTAIHILRANSSDPVEVHRIIDSKLTGLKRRSFYNNMSEPGKTQDVTVDTWAARALLNTNSKGHKLETIKGKLYASEISTGGGSGYRAVSESTRRVAEKMGLAPDEVQAAYWTAVRDEVAFSRATAKAAKKAAAAQAAAAKKAKKRRKTTGEAG